MPLKNNVALARYPVTRRLGVREQADRGVVGRGCGLRVSATDQGEQQQRPDSSPANAVSDETLHRVGHYFLCLMNLAHGVWSTNSRGSYSNCKGGEIHSMEEI